jgi:hypothetical protein
VVIEQDSAAVAIRWSSGSDAAIPADSHCQQGAIYHGFGTKRSDAMPITASCHCCASRFEVETAPDSLTRCTCTFCTKRGGLWAYYQPSQFKLLTPRENMATYQREGTLGQHHFCPTCGCGTFTDTPDFSTGEPDFEHPVVSINTRLLDDFDLDAVPVTVIDGRNLW